MNHHATTPAQPTSHPASIPVESLRDLGWFDLELTRTGQLKAIGACYQNRTLHRGDLNSQSSRDMALAELERFLVPATFVAGHNLLAFDAPQLRTLRPQSPLLKKPVLDTLVLSALAFPKKPYHKLIKDYKLVKDAISDPVRDCELAQNVLQDAMRALIALPAEVRGVLAGLLQRGTSYRGMGQWLATLAPTPDLTVAPTLQNAIAAVLAHQSCPRGVERLLTQHPPEVSWAFLIAWTRVAGDGSAIPLWVLRQWPTLRELSGLLRGQPCDDPTCAFCSTHHNPAKFLPRFGIESGFRPTPATPTGQSAQQVIVESVYRRQSTLAILPTGGGKSLCYQLPALARYEATGELTVIISPLQSLMKDQVDGVESKLGARLAEAVSGMLSPVERQVTFERVARGETAMLYLSPEQLRNPSVMNLLQTRTIGCWVYDEAHCVSKWGHDFRPDYLAVARFIRELSGPSTPQVCALTATAKADVIAEILKHFQEELGLSLTVHNGGSERDNLQYEVRLVEEKAKHAEIAELIGSHLSGSGAAIVFASTRKRAESVAQYLTSLSIPAEAYHAGLEQDQKKHLQNRYLRNEVRVICATNAFGMGVDKPDIRLVIHLDAPGSLENYLQEAGRAGRDREQALCVLLYTEDDLERQFRLSAYSELSRRDINSVLRALRQAAKRLKIDPKQEFHITVGEILQQDDRLEEDGADTKVKTAVAWLERKGFLQRNLNHNRVWSGRPKVNSMDEARAIIAKLSLAPRARDQWLAVMNRLLEEGTGESVSSDELLGCLQSEGASNNNAPEAPGRLMDLLKQMENAGLLKQEAIYQLFVDHGVSQGSLWRCNLAERTERDLLQWMREQDPDAAIEQPLRLDVAAALRDVQQTLRSSKLGNEGAQGINQQSLRRMLELVARDGLAWIHGAHLLTKREISRNEVELLLHKPLEELERAAQQRQRLTRRILEHAISRLRDAESRGKNLRVELSLDELRQLLHNDLILSTTPPINEDQAIEGAMYALHELKIATVRSSRAVIRQAMGIQLIPQSAARRVVEGDLEELKTYYKEKRIQIRTMGLFATLAARKIADALRLMLDYFRLPRTEFVQRYRQDLGPHLDLPTSPDSLKKIVDALGDKDQQEIVTADPEKNRLVLAGPGSGKTKTLVHRIAWLVRVKRIPPWRVFVITFNRLAAHQVRSRLRDLIGPEEAGQVRVHTYHALAMRVLNVSMDLQSRYDPNAEVQFDAMIVQATQVLRGDQTVLGIDPQEAFTRLLGRVAYVLIDEYQDIDQPQYEFLSVLTQRVEEENESKPSVFAVGDDDQNIYAFRHTSTRFIRQFEEDYRAERSVLRSNYRSTPAIVQVTQRLISHNRDRMKADVQLVVDPRRRKGPVGAPVRVLELGPQTSEVEAIVHQLQAWNAQQVDWSRMAVLSRQRDIIHQVRAACELLKIPVRHQQTGRSLSRLVHVRECWSLLERLKALSDEPIDQKRMMALLDAPTSFTGRSEPSGASNRWTDLLGVLVKGCWDGLSPNVPVPASKLRDELMDALFEVGREFTLGQGVFLSTVHSAKGLEFERVLIPDRGWSMPANDRTKQEEECRLFYVGCTRAKDELVVLAAPDHPLAPELRGAQVVFDSASTRPLALPASLEHVRYNMLELGDIYLSYPAIFESSHRVHRDLAQTQPGDPVELHESNGKVAIFAQNQKIGVLSTDASRTWLSQLHTIERANVVAFVVRFADQGLPMEGSSPKVPQWEVPIVEIKTVGDQP